MSGRQYPQLKADEKINYLQTNSLGIQLKLLGRRVDNLANGLKY